jgi:hypothetical protein
LLFRRKDAAQTLPISPDCTAHANGDAATKFVF